MSSANDRDFSVIPLISNPLILESLSISLVRLSMMTKKVRGERGHPCATPTETVYSWLSLPLAYTLRFGEIAHKLSLGTSISEPSIKYRTKQLIKLIGKIPPEIIKALTRPVEAITPGELICWQAYDPNWSLDDNGWRYGQTLDINGTQAIQELYVDTSGVPTPVGDPHLPHHRWNAGG